MVDLDQILRGAGQIIDTGLNLAVGIHPGARQEDRVAADAYLAAQVQMGISPPPRSLGDWWQLRLDAIETSRQIRMRGQLSSKLAPPLRHTLSPETAATASPDSVLSQGALLCTDPSLDLQNLICQ